MKQEFSKDSIVSGVYAGTFKPLKRESVKQFRNEAEQAPTPRSRGEAQDFLPVAEEAYWKGIGGRIIYGADNPGSLFDRDMKAHC